MKVVWRAVLIFCLLCGPATALEVRPAYLELRAKTETIFDMMFKLPALGGRPLKVNLVIPDGCKVEQSGAQDTPGAEVLVGRVVCSAPPYGRPARLEGLKNTLTDALVRVVQPSGEVATLRLTPEDTIFSAPKPTSRLDVLRTYGALGVAHILTGFDYLAFVAGLLLLVGTLKRLLTTVTALREAGLPPQEIPISLLAFNLGVEAGQVMFILAVMAVAFVLRRIGRLPRHTMLRGAGYAIGGLAAFWFIDRVSAILTA